MKSFFVVALLVAAAVAAPAGPDADAVIVRQSQDNIGVDGFSYESETSNGIVARAQGVVNGLNTENPELEVRGEFSYTGPDGVVYSVSYIANKDGFQPAGAHLPVPPS